MRSNDEQSGLPSLGQRRKALDRLPERNDVLCVQGIGRIGDFRKQPQAACDGVAPLQLTQPQVAVRKDWRVGCDMHEHELAAEPWRKQRGESRCANGIGAINADDDWTCHFEPPVECSNIVAARTRR
jgi:hypothetical protein